MNIVITGVSKGIGKELVNQYLNSTLVNKIYACTSSKSDVSFNDNRVEVLDLDLSNGSSISSIVGEIKVSEIDLLINNAGYLRSSGFSESSIDDVRQMFEINYFGPYQLIQKLLPLLKAGAGQVINIGSMGGYQGSLKFDGLAAYSCSKAALACLSECLAVELASANVSVNCLALGAVNTEMLQKAFPDYISDVTPKEIASFVKLFSESTGKLINGKIIPVSRTTP